MVVVNPREYLRALELTGGEPPLDSLVGRVANGAAAVGVGPPLTQVTTEPPGSGQRIQALRAPKKDRNVMFASSMHYHRAFKLL